MTTITGTVVSAWTTNGATKVRLKTGGNGRARYETILLEGKIRLRKGSPVEITGADRDSKAGTYTLGRGGQIRVLDGAHKPAQKATAVTQRTSDAEAPAFAHLLPQVNPSAAALIKKGLTPEQIAVLQGYTPARFLQVRKIRGREVVTYVDHHYVVAALNFAFGHSWTEEYEAPIFQGDHVATRCRLTVTFPDGTTAARTATGGHPIARYTGGEHAGEVIDLGDAIKAAEADALKKAASKFGIAWDVYAGVTVHPDATKGPKAIYSVVEERPRIAAPSSAPAVEAVRGPTPEQIEYAVKAFGGDPEALVNAARETDPNVQTPQDIGLDLLKRLALGAINRNKAARVEQAARKEDAA